MNISRKNLIIFTVIILVLVAAGIWIGMNLGNAGGSSGSGYTAVYLATGDIYFGKFSWFPTPHMTDAWFLQRGVNQQNQPTVGLAPFKNVAWAGQTLYFNDKQIIMWTPIPADSQFAQGLANPSLMNQSQGQIPVPATSTPGTNKR